MTKKIKIIPIGIDYSDYYKFRRTLFVNIGDPIEVSEYWKDYETNPAVAMNKLRDRLAEEIKKVMIHIETQEFYELYMGLRKIYNRSLCKKLKLNPHDLYNQHKADKMLIEALDNCLEKDQTKIEGLNKVFKQYQDLKKELNYRDWVPQKKRYCIIGNAVFIVLSLITLPLVLLGLFNNWPQFFIPSRITKGIRDKQFHSTAKWGFGAALMIIYYILLFILALLFLPFWWLKILYVLTLPSSGIYALSYRKFLIKSWMRVRYSIEMILKKPKTQQLKSSYDQLAALTEQIYNEFSSGTQDITAIRNVVRYLKEKSGDDNKPAYHNLSSQD